MEVKASGPPHVLEMWLGVSKGMLPVKCVRSNKAFFMLVEFHGDHKTVIKLRLFWPCSVFWDITGYKSMVSVCSQTYFNFVFILVIFFILMSFVCTLMTNLIPRPMFAGE